MREEVDRTERHEPSLGVQSEDGSRLLRTGFVLSGVVAAMMIIASALGVSVASLYKEGLWAKEAFRGGDLITLFVVSPAMIVALVLSRRGSVRALMILAGTVVYAIYNYAFATFGARFNDGFLLHIAIFSSSIYALICLLAGADLEVVRRALPPARRDRWIAGLLVGVGAIQAGLWIFLILRNAITGAVLHDIPVSGQHLVFALDLGLSMPALILGGALLWRRSGFGYLLGSAMVVMAALYQLNLLVAGLVQANADVPGVKAFAPEGVLLTAVFAVAAVVMLAPRRRGRRAPTPVRLPQG
jgi:hypothetical protein